jgi:hypothetical protein
VHSLQNATAQVSKIAQRQKRRRSDQTAQKTTQAIFCAEKQKICLKNTAQQRSRSHIQHCKKETLKIKLHFLAISSFIACHFISLLSDHYIVHSSSSFIQRNKSSAAWKTK